QWTRGSVEFPTGGFRRFAHRFGSRLLVICGVVGVVAMIPLGLTNKSIVTGGFADLAVGALVLAVIAGVVHTGLDLRVRRLAAPAEVQPAWMPDGRRKSSKWWALGIVVIALLAASTWFTAGTVFASGDNVPPQGLAWMSHMFDSWIYSGTDLGTPNTDQLLLPWAMVLQVVRVLGGSAGLAQAFWMSGLFAGGALAAFGFLRLLRLSPPAAFVGGLFYVFSTYTVAMVDNSAVFLAGEAVFPTVACIVLAVGIRRVRVSIGAILLALTVPLCGYVYANPPSVLLIGLSAVLAAVIALFIEGRQVIRLYARLLGVAVPLLLLVGAYWIVPNLIAARVAATGQLAPTAAWQWTEIRATLANALWLNNDWGWKYAYYYPFAHTYRHLPLLFLKYVPPALAFASLPLTFARKPRYPWFRPLVLLIAGVALFFIILSNGTRLPGSIIFNVLYRLPDGWLLREPGRFLLAPDFCYAVLIAVSVESLGDVVRARAWRRRRPSSDTAGRTEGTGLWKKVGIPSPAWGPRIAIAVVLLLLAAPAYPLIFGQEVPTAAASSHMQNERVKLPQYWTSMADYLNTKATTGLVLTLPPNPQYQMPYTWGYDGADGFIPDMIRSPVVDPVPTSYYTVSGQLLNTVNRLAQDLLAKRWVPANRLANAIGARYLLVRGDVKSKGANPPIIAPEKLLKALAQDPLVKLVHVDGALELYSVPATGQAPEVVTDSAQTPNLESLNLFPAGTAIIRSKPRPDLPAIFEMPPLTQWRLERGGLRTTVTLPRGRKYTPETVAPWGTSTLSVSKAGAADIKQKVVGNVTHLTMSLGKTLIHDGDFSSGGWQGKAQDCWAPEPGRVVSGQLLAGGAPGGANALQLTSRRGITCEYAQVKLTHSPLLVSLMTRNVKGLPAQVCVWYAPKKLCSAPPLAVARDKSRWHRSQWIIDVPAKARSLRLEIYSPEASGGVKSVNEFANVTVYALDVNRTQSPVLVSPAPHPDAGSATHLTQTATSASGQWNGPAGAQRVVVDGMRNGWLGAGSAADVSYGPAGKIKASYIASVLGVGMALLLLAYALYDRQRRHA
ncbi:MAG TPA: hypothetical protein VME01_00255, partial [Solirubrobacteraceae bacterium]|nr:hypothetical protein [Solirubrobacteraceae bacterium]